MAKKNPPEGSVFVRYFGPPLDALRDFAGSSTPYELVARIAKALQLSLDRQGEQSLADLVRAWS